MNHLVSQSFQPTVRRVNISAAAYLLRVLTISIALLIHSALSIELISDLFGFGANSFLLIGYLYLEIRNLRTYAPHHLWINPIVLASVFTFAMCFGISNVLYFLPDEMVFIVGLQPNVTVWMNQLMLLVLMGACAMWTGYSSGAGRNLGRLLQANSALRKWISISGRVKMPMLFMFLGVSLISRLVAIKMGVFGYSSTYDQLIEGAAYREYLSMGESLGKLALVGVALQCFSAVRPAFADRQLLWLVCGYEVAFGFLSGFKSPVIMPFVVLGIVFYSQRNRFPRWMVPALVAALMAAYAVIEPFRIARNADVGFSGTSVRNITSTLASGVNARGDGSSAPTPLKVLRRLNTTHVASLGIEYAANNELPIGSPNFLEDILLAPVHAVVPRLLWQSKSLQNAGLWYTHEVVGHDYFSSTGMSPFTYLNFAGGALAVIIGFLFLGILQRALFDGLRAFGNGGLVVFLGLLGTLSTVDSSFNSILVGIIRYLPILIVAQYLLLQRSPRPCAE